jgi:hypothetical protein
VKITENMRFAHPVLWANTGDYRNAEFSATGLEVVERLDTGEVRINCTLTLNQPELRQLVDKGDAKTGLFITCLETYCNELHPIPVSGGPVRLPEGRLKGRVVLRPILWATRSATGFTSCALHEEYGTSAIGFPEGAVLGLGDESVINVGREKLAPLESIFQLSRSNTVAPDQIAVQMEGEKVNIMARDATYTKIYALRGTVSGRALLLNSIYLPAVMHVLASLKESTSIYEGKRWHRIFTARLDHLGLGVDGDALDGAQKLLDSPFRQVNTEATQGF